MLYLRRASEIYEFEHWQKNKNSYAFRRFRLITKTLLIAKNSRNFIWKTLLETKTVNCYLDGETQANSYGEIEMKIWI